MKTQYILLLALVLGGSRSFAQGTFIFDQQDSTAEGSPAYGSGSSIQANSPGDGQSFTPTLSGVDFIRLTLIDDNPADGLGASIFLNLRADSITGPILGTTATANMNNGFSGPVTFLFPNGVSVSPGTHYFFDLNLVSGGPWNAEVGSFTYPGGEAYGRGQPYPGSEFWFREGIIAPVPEPSAYALLLAGSALIFCYRRKGQ